jgi:hypothetical protein
MSRVKYGFAYKRKVLHLVLFKLKTQKRFDLKIRVSLAICLFKIKGSELDFLLQQNIQNPQKKLVHSLFKFKKRTPRTRRKKMKIENLYPLVLGRQK